MSVPRVISAVAVTWALATLFTHVARLLQNIAKSKKTGLDYVICPFDPHNPIWRTLQGPILTLLKTVLGSWTPDTLIVMTKDWAYLNDGYKIWHKLGDTFLIATPWGLGLYTRCPEVIHQITSRREAFPKAVEQYGVLEMLGANIVTTEGAVWKMHRKASSPLFNEKSAAFAFEEAIRQTQGMLRLWRGGGDHDDQGQDQDQDAADARNITSLAHDTMTLALNIIGTVGFGLRFLWPGEEASDNTDSRMNKYTRLEKDSDYVMTFPEATAGMLENIFAILLTPSILLPRLPFKWARTAHESNENYVQYMRELVKDKKDDLHKGVAKTDESMNIVGALLRTKEAQQHQQQPNELKKDTTPPDLHLTDDAVISNAFIMMLAGHETSANVLHFATILLAAHPSSQRAMQAELDEIFPDGAEDPACWRFEHCINDLLTSMPGAVLNETLRFLPPVVVVPKQVSPASDQVVRLGGDGGREHVLPAGTTVSVTVVAAARNEKHWPPNEAGESDVNEWVPERWFRASASLSSASTGPIGSQADGDESEDDGDGLETTSAGAARPMFRPARGLFIPFSDGARSCLGRRMARVEIVTALAVIFRKYSVELAVDEWADDQAVERMDTREMVELYEKAKAKCRQTLQTATSMLTLKLPSNQHVPVRVVKRGKERFVGRV